MIKSEYTVLGLMSGTSLDGLDMALCHFMKIDEQWKYEVIAAATTVYPNALRIRLDKAITLSAYEFVKLDVDLSIMMAEYVRIFLVNQSVNPDFISSHGHTIFHQPVKGITSQLGNGAILAAYTGITTVCDFRKYDVALGGQGAPLVPIGDELLFGYYDVCLNLGGFSNISFHGNGRRLAFDVSPCNMALNYLANQIGLLYDCDGEIARSGNIDTELFDLLNKIDFYHICGAKSLGKEWFDTTFRPYIDMIKISVPDKLRTVIEHIAYQIAIVSGEKKGRTMLVTGGGARNIFLVERLQDLCSMNIVIPDDQTIDFKEAIIFAFLGILRIRGERNCLCNVTGAYSDCCSGAVYVGKN